ncbi:inter-alpha-trypsin inhibitor heavy chain H4-like [Liolophura sinensis]|uniref:inter-alpha-trypsin inhibitor heavy chain H4-like n=1 Tax=Liolophura sinensis TaxID=3198878 RepID=UPI003159729D
MAGQALRCGLTNLAVVLILFTTMKVRGYNLVARRESEFTFKNDVVVVPMRHRRFVNNDVIAPPANIVKMNIDSRTSSRYTQVLVESVVMNDQMESREAKFIVQIPETAFISNFSMLINDTWFIADVMNKSAAEQVYKDAQSKGESAGHVGTDTYTPSPRGMENFKISINVAAESEVEFKLLYSELLERRLGVYRQRISIRPGQTVENLTLSAQLYEPQGFASFKFSPPGESTLLESSRTPDVQLTASDTFKSVAYTMSIAAQRKLDAEKGSDGEFIIEYDVRRENEESRGGVLLVDSGYFVHYIAPSDPNLVTLNKNVAFVIDVSGSMSGEKIIQTRQAMKTILSQLRPDDYFNILLFSSNVRSWEPRPIRGSAENIARAKRFVDDHVKADGGTNIDAALREAGNSLSQLMTGLSERRGRMIVFLTDGMPSVGETNTVKIRKNVRTWNIESKLPIFSLGFGMGVSIDFLQQLSWENLGFARQIYEDTDGVSQLSNFFTEIESVILLDIHVTYDTDAVEVATLTSTTFPQYFKGSEIIVAGEITPSAPQSWSAQVSASGKTDVVNYNIPVTGQNTYDTNVAPWSAGFAEKLRAYLKIKDLIREMSIAPNKTVEAALEQEAIALSLRYNFVTPVTSMVITQSSRSVENELSRDMAISAIVGSSLGKASSIGVPSMVLLYLTSLLTVLLSSAGSLITFLTL